MYKSRRMINSMMLHSLEDAGIYGSSENILAHELLSFLFFIQIGFGLFEFFFILVVTNTIS